MDDAVVFRGVEIMMTPANTCRRCGLDDGRSQLGVEAESGMQQCERAPAANVLETSTPPSHGLDPAPCDAEAESSAARGLAAVRAEAGQRRRTRVPVGPLGFPGRCPYDETTTSPSHAEASTRSVPPRGVHCTAFASNCIERALQSFAIRPDRWRVGRDRNRQVDATLAAAEAACDAHTSATTSSTATASSSSSAAPSSSAANSTMLSTSRCNLNEGRVGGLDELQLLSESPPWRSERRISR